VVPIDSEGLDVDQPKFFYLRGVLGVHWNSISMDECWCWWTPVDFGDSKLDGVSLRLMALAKPICSARNVAPNDQEQEREWCASGEASMIPFHFDWTINLPEVVVLGLNVIVLVRIFLVMRDYPPHRHVRFNGKGVIVYPKGMSPAEVQEEIAKEV
jgi:hypothetical protein